MTKADGNGGGRAVGSLAIVARVLIFLKLVSYNIYFTTELNV